MPPEPVAQLWEGPQSEMTIVNINADAEPMILRGNHPDPSSPATLINLGRFLEAENALIISVSMSPGHLAVVAALQEDWVPRFQTIMQPGWHPQSLPQQQSEEAPGSDRTQGIEGAAKDPEAEVGRLS
ncbi:hypothetical protein BOTBODRAFT_178520 [Botryobasidium botryosum FD-172 SS1]|uniref:Uncharacterized protein n=1 Tax=Botryobasidium botryosum (strain FD-172 SS1) TaxID=930990 RepID=A0A067MDL0_BOTB1|nr:hypothetical protein BOTBODRAFT_178520 [Botryobasidium botryosum FD-172 SS1]